MKNSKLKDERGIVLVAALLMLLVITLLGISGMNTSTYDLRMTGNSRASEEALYAADAGIQDAISRLSVAAHSNHITDTAPTNPSWTTNILSSPAAFNNTYPANATYSFAVTHYGSYTDGTLASFTPAGSVWQAANGSPYYLIRSTGTSGSARMTLEALVVAGTPVYNDAIVGCSGVQLADTVEGTVDNVIDSYNSTLNGGNYDLQATHTDSFGNKYAGSNGNVSTVLTDYTLTPGCTAGNRWDGNLYMPSTSIPSAIHGNVTAAGTVRNDTAPSHIFGTKTENAPRPFSQCDTIPGGIRAFVDGKEPPGDWSPGYGRAGNYSVPRGGATFIGPGTYKYNDFSISGEELTIAGSGDVTLYVKGQFQLSSGGKLKINRGVNLTIYVKGDFSVGGEGTVANENMDPKALRVYQGTEGTAGSQLSISRGADFYGTITAPLSALTVGETSSPGQGASIFGAVVAGCIRLSKAGGIHFDESLRSSGGGSAGGYSVMYVRQVQN